MENGNSIKGAEETKDAFVNWMRERYPHIGFQIGLGICPDSGKYTLEVRLTRSQRQFAIYFPSEVNGYKLNVFVGETPRPQ